MSDPVIGREYTVDDVSKEWFQPGDRWQWTFQNVGIWCDFYVNQEDYGFTGPGEVWRLVSRETPSKEPVERSAYPIIGREYSATEMLDEWFQDGDIWEWRNSMRPFEIAETCIVEDDDEIWRLVSRGGVESRQVTGDAGSPICSSVSRGSDRSDPISPETAHQAALRELESDILARAPFLKWSDSIDLGGYRSKYSGETLISGQSEGTRLGRFSGFSTEFSKKLVIIAETAWFRQMVAGAK